MLDVVRNVARYRGPVVRKVRQRFTEPREPVGKPWCAEHTTDLHAVVADLDPDGWAAAESAAADRRARARVVLEGLPNLGGGGDHVLLSWLAHRAQGAVVETGVAAGWSSWAILEAGSRLWSSDLPYFRLPNPEKYVGVLVPEHLRDSWTLLLEGDRANLPRILADCGPVGLFHYDSDKTAEGRTWALGLVEPLLTADAIAMFDDVADNLHFQQLVESRDWGWAVVRFEGKYLGVTGPGYRTLFG